MTDATDWTGRVGESWAAEWCRTDRSLADLSRHLDAAILAAAPSRAFRALDIGCGAGATSLALAAARPDATIVGIDLSDALIAVARERAARHTALARGRQPMATADPVDGTDRDPRLGFHAGDVTTLAAAYGPHGLFCSRHGVMFFDDPVAAFAALHAAAAPDARLVFSCFRDWSRNSFACDLGAAVGTGPPLPGPGPFAFADRAKVAAILAAAGWRDVRVTPVDFSYRAGAGDDPEGDALSFLQRIGPAAAALRATAPAERPALLERVRAVIARHRVAGAIDFPAAAWIWSAKA